MLSHLSDMDDVVHIQVFGERNKDVVIFETKCSWNVTKGDLMRMSFMRDGDYHFVSQRIHLAKQYKFQASGGYPRVAPQTSPVMAVGLDGVLRSHSAVPSSKCVMLLITRSEDAEKVLLHRETLEELDVHFCDFPASIGKLQKLKKLVFSYLVDLPPTIFQLSSLKELVLEGYTIKTIPNELWTLKQLEKLTLDFRRVKGILARGLGKLSRLKELSICRCKIRSLSIIGLKKLEKLSLMSMQKLEEMSLSECPKLKELTIKSCGIESLSKSFAEAKLLERLSLSHLHLKTIPEEIGKLSHLKHLEVEWTPLRNLPNSIGMLKRLEVLTLYQLKSVDSIPNTIGGLNQLKRLEIDSCDFESLPKSIFEMKQLEELFLEYVGSMKSIPEEIGELSNLKVLKICYCKVESLPTRIWRLTQLEKLSLSNLKNVKNISADFGELENLRVLRFCNFPNATVSIVNMEGLKRLEKLHLAECPGLLSFPEEIGQLSRLRKLVMNSFDWSAFPKSLSYMRQLRILRLQAFKKLKSLPEEIGQMSSLEELCIDRCGIESLPKSLNQMSALKSIELYSNVELVLCPEDIAAFSRMSMLYLRQNTKDFPSGEDGDIFKLFCEMLKTSVHLYSVYLDWDYDEMFLSALKENSSMVRGSIKDNSFFQRNKDNRGRARASATCMIAIRRCRRGMLGIMPKEIIVMIAQMLWITRCDVEAWSVKTQKEKPKKRQKRDDDK